MLSLMRGPIFILKWVDSYLPHCYLKYECKINVILMINAAFISVRDSNG